MRMQGKALTGLGRYREAMQCFDQGLKFDPFNARMKAGQDEAVRLHVKELAGGEQPLPRGLYLFCH